MHRAVCPTCREAHTPGKHTPARSSVSRSRSPSRTPSLERGARSSSEPPTSDAPHDFDEPEDPDSDSYAFDDPDFFTPVNSQQHEGATHAFLARGTSALLYDPTTYTEDSPDADKKKKKTSRLPQNAPSIMTVMERVLVVQRGGDHSDHELESGESDGPDHEFGVLVGANNLGSPFNSQQGKGNKSQASP